MQEFTWNGRKTLFIEFEDTTDRIYPHLAEIIDSKPNIDLVVFPFDLMFIPKELRDRISYQKTVYVIIKGRKRDVPKA